MSEEVTTPPVDTPPADTPPVETPPVIEQTTTSWRDSLSEDLRGNPSILKFNSPDDLAKSYIEAQKAIGSKRLELPQEDWDETKYQEFFKQIGLPDDPKDYGIGKPEGLPDGLPYNEELKDNLLALAHKQGILPRQLKPVWEAFEKAQIEQFQALQQQQTVTAEEGARMLREEWGKEYEANVEQAKVAIKALGGESLAEKLVKAGLGSDPDVVKAFAAAGKGLVEDESLGKYRADGLASTPQSAEIQINSLYADPEFMKSYNGQNGPEAKKQAHARMETLFKVKHGER